MGFDAAKFIWQIVNFLMLIGILGLIFFVPARVFKRMKAIEDRLEQMNRKIEAMELNTNNKL